MARPDWLPAGQSETSKFPVVGEAGPAPGWNRESFRLGVDGLVERPLQLDFSALLQLPVSSRSVDIHCVTGWSRRAVGMSGWPLHRVLDLAGVLASAQFVRFIAHSARGHDTSLPLAIAQRDTWLVHQLDGRELAPEHGGPLRAVTPGRYFYKSLKWLERIELLAQDRPGYWERESAYHNQADPWREQRFDESRVAQAAQVQALREATDFTAHRDRVWIKARLGGWQPGSRDLSGLQLKYCSLRAARLAGTLWRGANLSLSNLEGADLAGARFLDCDLEGASLAGADLRGVQMDGVALSATRFFRDFPGGRRLAARVEGLRIRRAQGLLEDQAAFLAAAGVPID